MPIPIPPPSGPTPVIPSPTPPLAPVTPSPYYLREHQGWAVQQEQQRHGEALYWVGEWVVLVLLWHLIDFQRGLVTRCQVCYATTDALANRVTAVYQQPTKQKCPDCLGTTFEGGFRARIVRPAICTDVDEDEQTQRRGSIHPASLNVETTVDFRARPGDYMLRADNSRWQLSLPSRTTLRTGFEHPSQAATGISYGSLRASYEEPTQIVYQVPPTDPADLSAVLSQPMHYPADFSAFEVKRASLIPPAYLD